MKYFFILVILIVTLIPWFLVKYDRLFYSVEPWGYVFGCLICSTLGLIIAKGINREWSQ